MYPEAILSHSLECGPLEILTDRSPNLLTLVISSFKLYTVLCVIPQIVPGSTREEIKMAEGANPF